MAHRFRRRTGRRTPRGHDTHGNLTLEEIHRALPTEFDSVELSPTMMKSDEERASSTSGDQEAMDVDEKTTKSMKAITSSASSDPFHDALHEYLLFARPKQYNDLEKLVTLITNLAELCGTSPDQWKVFILVSFQRRYHAKAPAAKAILIAKEKSQDKKDEDISGDSADAAAEGDGERLIFYMTCLCLHRMSHIIHQRHSQRTSSSSNKDENVYVKLLEAAVLGMVEAAQDLGGTRDINALIEHLCFEELLRSGYACVGSSSAGVTTLPEVPSPFRSKLLPAVKDICFREESQADYALNKAVGIASQLLDSDLEKCTKATTKKMVEPEDFMSTIHVMLPHHYRGNKKGSTWQRNLTNCVAEILIWSKTLVGKTDDRFRRAFSELCKLATPTSPPGDDKTAPTRSGEESVDGYDYILRMQTSARKHRKRLNDHARTNGFLLSSLYLMNRTGISFRQICRGKAGDLAVLKHLASKFKDSNILNMLLKRNLDPTKASPAESISSLISGWHDVNAKIDDEDSIEAFELKIQSQTVRATIERLRPKKLRTSDEDNSRSVLVVKLGSGKKKETVAAILVAAALHPHDSRLIINSKEYENGLFETEESVSKLLNAVILDEIDASSASSDEMTANEIIQEHMEDSQDIIFLSSADVELDEQTLQDLTNKDKTIRVHSASRVESVEPISIELDTDIYEKLKSGSPVSVAVLLDCTGSMGSEIAGCKRGALKLIDMFNDLAPVRWANFIGYWDPISSRRDPNPRSCGYLDPREKSNLERIQTFVDSELPCTGGGDEPEDIPAALEKLADDIEKAGISADEGVHFVFFIADAGYRDNEEARVERLLSKLRKLGIVMVMCPVRQYGTCETLVTKNRSIFSPGYYIELGQVSELKSIAATVTESIRASLFKSGNIMSVTASVGDTMESIQQLCNFQRDHASLKRVAELSEPPHYEEEEDRPPNEDEPPHDEEKEDEPFGEESLAVSTENEKKASTPKTDHIFARREKFCLTNVDRIYLQISRLPEVCRLVVDSAFGGRSLREIIAADVAKRLLENSIPVRDLDGSGYPRDLVDLVREMMGGHGIKRKIVEAECN